MYFEEGELKRIIYNYKFYDKKDENGLFLALCARMQVITPEPMWYGYRTLDYPNMYFSDDTSCFKEIPISDVKQCLEREEIFWYRYLVDIENKYYTDYDVKCGYKPFDPDSIKKDAKWIQGLDDVKVITISRMDQSGIIKEGWPPEEIVITLEIEK